MTFQPDISEVQALQNSINAVAVSGFKSIIQEQSIGVMPLTLLAGANSTGKSSIMQPLLLLKQTLEAAYDPGPLLLDGPNVKFTDKQQVLARNSPGAAFDHFTVAIGIGGDRVQLRFSQEKRTDLELTRMRMRESEVDIELWPEMSEVDIVQQAPSIIDEMNKAVRGIYDGQLAWQVVRERCFLQAHLSSEYVGFQRLLAFPKIDKFTNCLRAIIHVPGLRGNPERTYKTTAVEQEFPGTFDNYVASVIAQWQAQLDPRLEQLRRDLAEVGLTTAVEANQLDSTQVEIRVARVPQKKSSKRADMVSIADVGFGVSQTLPVLVALLVARPGQLVYIEQPELHLHPRAQAALAPILARAAARGVKVVVETHSALLLRAVQTLVARGELASDLVKLHWFQRGDDGATTITSAKLDENGAFGQWPADFDEVILQTEAAYLDAVTFRS
jgi:predicted ATPase